MPQSKTYSKQSPIQTGRSPCKDSHYYSYNKTN